MLSLLTLITWLRHRIANKDSGEVSIEYVLVGGLAAGGIVLGMAVLFPGATGWFQSIFDYVSGEVETLGA